MTPREWAPYVAGLAVVWVSAAIGWLAACIFGAAGKADEWAAGFHAGYESGRRDASGQE